MNKDGAPSSVHLVGSIPLTSAEEVFKKVSSTLPQRLHAIPDGETGSRYNYIGWQMARFPRETIRIHLGGLEYSGSSPPAYTLQDVAPTEYDDVAISSYADFVRLRAQGTIPGDVRFQVSLPTPFNSIQGHTRPEFHEQLEPLYEQRFRESLTRIVKEIPNEDLAIQWDLTFDVMALEYQRGRTTDLRFQAYFSPVMQGILARISRLCALIPSSVKLGFHLCYGDLRHQHFIEPVDTELLVGLANDIIQSLADTRPVDWIHMPVPKGRTDEAYFDPLKALNLRGALLYLGLVHANDESGTRERIRVARSVYIHPFGVATECGIGRTAREELDSILQICEAVTVPKAPSKL